MHDNFLALKREKRDRIINAALGEFSSRGFKNASTNEIVKKAGISKGSLFHYFSTKKELYEFLIHYSIKYLETCHKHTEKLPEDIFLRWLKVAIIKKRLATQYPDVASFMQNANKDSSSDIQDITKGMETGSYSEGFSVKIYDDLDISKFKPDVDIEKAVHMIWWVLEGIARDKQRIVSSQSKAQESKVADSITSEVEGYVKMLKEAFYREEYW